MDRLSTGEKIAGASAVLLFIFMFFSWFSVEGGGLIEGRQRLDRRLGLHSTTSRSS